jgi:hypothetical protein
MIDGYFPGTVMLACGTQYRITLFSSPTDTDGLYKSMAALFRSPKEEREEEPKKERGSLGKTF